MGYKLVSTKLLENVMASQAQLAAQIQGITAQVSKAKDEITAKISDLTNQIGAAQVVSPEVTQALSALQAAVQAVDDIVP